MSKLKDIAKKFGISPKNGMSARLQKAQQRVDNAEQMAMEALERMKNSRLGIDKEISCNFISGRRYR